MSYEVKDRAICTNATATAIALNVTYNGTQLVCALYDRALRVRAVRKEQTSWNAAVGMRFNISLDSDKTISG